MKDFTERLIVMSAIFILVAIIVSISIATDFRNDAICQYAGYDYGIISNGAIVCVTTDDDNYQVQTHDSIFTILDERGKE